MRPDDIEIGNMVWDCWDKHVYIRCPFCRDILEQMSDPSVSLLKIVLEAQWVILFPKEFSEVETALLAKRPKPVSDETALKGSAVICCDCAPVLLPGFKEVTT